MLEICALQLPFAAMISVEKTGPASEASCSLSLSLSISLLRCSLSRLLGPRLTTSKARLSMRNEFPLGWGMAKGGWPLVGRGWVK